MGDQQAVLLIDLGGVLFEFDHQHRLEVLGCCLGPAPGKADALLWRSGFSADCDAGRYPNAAAVRAEIRRRTGYVGPDEDLDATWCSAFRPGQDVLSMLARYGGRLGVFTNNGPLEEEVLTRLYPRAFEPFAHLLFCHRIPSSTTRSPGCWPCRPRGSASPTTARTTWRQPASADGTPCTTVRPPTLPPSCTPGRPREIPAARAPHRSKPGSHSTSPAQRHERVFWGTRWSA